MLKKLPYKSILLFLIVSVTGCDSWLTVKPQDAIIRQEFWKTKEQVESEVFGCYASLIGTSDGQRTLAESMFQWGEIRADMIAANTYILSEELDILNGNIVPLNSIASWKTFYRTINYCNTILQFAPDVLKRDPTFKQAKLDAYTAEMLTLRSLMYFYLVRTFKEVPLKIKATTSDNDPYAIPKSTEEEVINQILNDLAEAEQKAVLSYGTAASNKGRVTRYTVNALQADVYLWAERYDDCIVACNKIINSNQFGLVQDSDWFRSIFATGNSNESIFEFQFDAQKINPFFDMFTTSRRWVASSIVLDEIYKLDFENPRNRDIRASDASLKANGLIWKYLGLDDSRPRISSESYAHWIIYRYADILLLKAEALAQIGQGKDALEIVNKIRDRAHALPTESQSAPPDDVHALSDFILEERSREFAFEGKRWYDVLRNARRNNYDRKDILITMIAKSAPPERQQSIINKLLDTNSHYLPIYQNEIVTNRNLIQNPFYLK